MFSTQLANFIYYSLFLFGLFLLFAFNTLQAKTGVVTIPPKIEGVEPYYDGRQPQSLSSEMISIHSANGAVHKIKVEIAKTLKEQNIGMMFREYVVEGTGMLFLYDVEGEKAFWMKNTLVPLDIIFIRKDGIISHIHPMAEPQALERILSNGKVLAVLEVGGGEAQLLGINVGDRVIHQAFNKGNSAKVKNMD